jgi:hypothetical protein
MYRSVFLCSSTRSTDLRRIGEASFLEDGATAKAPFVRTQRGITVDPSIRDLFWLIQSESWPAMIEKYLAMDHGFLSYLQATNTWTDPTEKDESG